VNEAPPPSLPRPIVMRVELIEMSTSIYPASMRHYSRAHPIVPSGVFTLVFSTPNAICPVVFLMHASRSILLIMTNFQANPCHAFHLSSVIFAITHPASKTTCSLPRRQNTRSTSSLDQRLHLILPRLRRLFRAHRPLLLLMRRVLTSRIRRRPLFILHRLDRLVTRPTRWYLIRCW